jgi:hypothetical protein
MSTNGKTAKNPPAQTGSGGGNVVSMSKCACDECSKRGELSVGEASFCQEHYAWFKFGLLTKEGKKPIDFDKKFAAYSKKRAA